MEMENSVLAAITRLFSATVFQQLATKGMSPLFARLIKEIGPSRIDPTGSVSDAFETAFAAIAQPGYRDEYFYKSAITRKVLLGRHSLRTAAMLTEVRVERCKADAVILNGTSTVYEIKSDRDNLARLPEQLASYRRAFASVCVITSDMHLKKVLEIAPWDVGVSVLKPRGSISTVRELTDLPDRIMPSSLFDVLRTQEAVQVLNAIGVSVPIVPNTERYGVVKNAFEKQCPTVLHAESVKVLRKTRSQLSLERFTSRLPQSLQAAGLSVQVRKGDQFRLLGALETPVYDAANWV
jgi:hypothetical protein